MIVFICPRLSLRYVIFIIGITSALILFPTDYSISAQQTPVQSPQPNAVSWEPMLPEVYREQVDLSGWLMSEKLDGVRGHWNGKELLSKNGKLLHPPKTFIKQLPPFAIEGELWGGRNTFEQTVSIVNTQHPHSGWEKIQFAIFDVPGIKGSFIERIAKATEWFKRHNSAYAFVIPQRPLSDNEQLKDELERIEQLGGEGLIVRNPDASYMAGRSMEILKVKSYQDAEATVIGYMPGNGRNAGRMGALLVQKADGLQFKIGGGFSDEERRAPPPIGSTITYKYYGAYQSGIPKFPSYLRIREDKSL